MDLFEIKDECRANLNKYTDKAFLTIPQIYQPIILDAGCGTGVPTLSIIKLCNGNIFAVDPDRNSTNWLIKKATALKLKSRIKIMNDSILNPKLFNFKFDIILAEGLLNVIGFKKGLQILINYLKSERYLIIHDEYKNDSEKREYFKKNNLSLLNSFELDENVWLNEYFYCLKSKIENIKENHLFENELKLINENISNPNNLKSIYYILQHEIND